MKQEEYLNETKIYRGALAEIDSKIPYLEAAEKNYNKACSLMKKTKNKYSLKYCCLLFLVGVLVMYVPAAILFFLMEIETTPFVISPVLSLLTVFLARTKYNNTKKSKELKAAKERWDSAKNEVMNIAEVILDLKSTAEESFSIISHAQCILSLNQFPDNLGNIAYLDCVYGQFQENNKITILQMEVQNIQSHLDKIKEQDPELYNLFINEDKKAMYRLGVLSHCERLAKENEKTEENKNG